MHLVAPSMLQFEVAVRVGFSWWNKERGDREGGETAGLVEREVKSDRVGLVVISALSTGELKATIAACDGCLVANSTSTLPNPCGTLLAEWKGVGHNGEDSVAMVVVKLLAWSSDNGGVGEFEKGLLRRMLRVTSIAELQGRRISQFDMDGHIEVAIYR